DRRPQDVVLDAGQPPQGPADVGGAPGGDGAVVDEQAERHRPPPGQLPKRSLIVMRTRTFWDRPVLRRACSSARVSRRGGRPRQLTGLIRRDWAAGIGTSWVAFSSGSSKPAGTSSRMLVPGCGLLT